MDGGPEERMVGEYEVGRRIGSGSFAVVRKARHRGTGMEVAVKEIDKKLLSPKVSESLLKEISILSTIDHPNIIRLYESIQTKDRIFLVLEYCGGGDLAVYLHRHGRVSEDVARHFMRQLAAGLQVLQEKHLIHRDLKPQNLLLSSNEALPCLKIGDFGFARSLTPQDLADTLCGSPLYMAPEIIQNKKYDAKADLWSVGAILFQLVTGKPPFNGENQYQLFRNILNSTELRFPQGTLEELHPDCVDLCRSLLRHNPVERLTFTEFFNHKFLHPTRPTGMERSSLPPQTAQSVELFDASISGKRSQLHGEQPTPSTAQDSKLGGSSVQDLTEVHVKDCRAMPIKAYEKMTNSVNSSPSSSCKLKAADLGESIEKDYVFVSQRFSSIENLSCFLESSMRESSTTRITVHVPKKKSKDPSAAAAKDSHSGSHSCAVKPSLDVSKSNLPAASCVSSIAREVQEPSPVNQPTKLYMLCQYVQAVAEVAQEKYKAEQFLESFSVELVVLAIWKKVLEICNSWPTSSTASTSQTTAAQGCTLVHGGIHIREPNNFNLPPSPRKWAEDGFVAAFDRSEKLARLLKDMNASTEMPDAMDLVYRKALEIGTKGAVDEFHEDKSSAAESYSKAMVLLSFIVAEASSLPLTPPFSLSPAEKSRIQRYIAQLQSHQSHFFLPQKPPKQPDSFLK